MRLVFSHRGFLPFLSCLLLLLAAACDDDLKARAPGLSWQAQPPADGPAVYFSVGEYAPGRLLATVSARGMEHVVGFALRLRIDPLKWRFVEFRPASAWALRPRAASAARDDLVLVGIGVPVDTGGETFSEKPVGTLVFEVLDASDAELSFIPEKSAVLDVSGAPVPDVTFSGGGLTRSR
jgi:hypothetical protein